MEMTEEGDTRLFGPVENSSSANEEPLFRLVCFAPPWAKMVVV
jgi:hypothetical protein